ncbi:MAG: hypothetical protein RIQ71_594 [Verrucomicrobiota bacterium]|jgi:hypothetical protein
MSDYSLELAAERITDARTKKYFAEVMVSYSSGCFRSSVVMLWSVAICDILFKLVQLAEHYGDSVAKGILRDIEATRLANPKSPEWEWKLVEEVKARTQLLEAGDYANLEALQKHRHLSAHPVLSASEVLFEPNKETARSHIRNTLEGLLTKPAIMTKKVFDAFVEDLEVNAAIFPDKSSLTKYLSAKYLSHLVPAVEHAMFRNLWRLVFRSDDVRCETNRMVNFRALNILYEGRRDDLKAAVAGERDYFSEVGLTGSRFHYFMRFVGTHPELFQLLTDAAKTPIEGAAKASLSNFAIAWFLSPNVDQHLEAIRKRVTHDKHFISGEAFDDLLDAAREFGVESKALDIAITQFGQSISFDMADGYFTSLIKPLLPHFSKDQLVELVKAIESNGQIHGRGRAASQHRLIVNVLDGVFAKKFDYAPYPKFSESVGIELKHIPSAADEQSS